MFKHRNIGDIIFKHDSYIYTSGIIITTISIKENPTQLTHKQPSNSAINTTRPTKYNYTHSAKPPQETPITLISNINF